MIFLIFLLCIGAGSIVWYTVVAGISPMPSTGKARKVILSLLQGHRNTGAIYELGCGWGGLLCDLARSYPERTIIGIELSPLPYWVCRLRCWWSGLCNVQLRRGNFLTMDLTDAAVVVCYLYPDAMRNLRPQLENLQSATVLISNTFAVPGWKPQEMVTLDDLYSTPVYLYRKG